MLNALALKEYDNGNTPPVVAPIVTVPLLAPQEASVCVTANAVGPLELTTIAAVVN